MTDFKGLYIQKEEEIRIVCINCHFGLYYVMHLLIY